MRALNLNLVVFNYFDVGKPVPSVSQMRQVSTALYDEVAVLPGSASSSIYVGGHSLGASFALGVAGQRKAKGLLLVGPSTSPAELNAYTYRPLTLLVRFAPDSDVAQLDNVAMARAISAPTLVVGSTGDKDVPPRFTKKVFAGLPASIKRKLVLLYGVDHAAYFLSTSLWQEISRFFGLPGAS